MMYYTCVLNKQIWPKAHSLLLERLAHPRNYVVGITAVCIALQILLTAAKNGKPYIIANCAYRAKSPLGALAKKNFLV